MGWNHCTAILLAEQLFEKGHEVATGWNFGPADDDAKPVNWICDELVKRWGDGAAWTLDGGDHPHEAHYLKLDSSKARMQLGWRSRLRLGEVLDRIVSWNRVVLDGGDIRTHTMNEIASYEAL